MKNHPLESCWAKLKRAEETIISLNREVNEYLLQKPPFYNISGKHQNNGLEYNLIVSVDSKVPLKFAVLAGEIIHHLRSSLDHLVHALVKEGGIEPNTKHQFPICARIEDFEKWKKNGRIDGISRSSEALIKSVQPFNNDNPEDTVLFVVGHLNNIDKHRKLVIASVGGQIGEKITIGSNRSIEVKLGNQLKAPTIIGFNEPVGVQLNEEGTVVFTIKLQEPAPQLEAFIDFVPELVFENWPNIPVSRVLSGMLEGTKHTIELFKNEFNITDEILPVV